MNWELEIIKIQNSKVSGSDRSLPIVRQSPSEEKVQNKSQKNYNPNCPNISEFTNNPNEKP